MIRRRDAFLLGPRLSGFWLVLAAALAASSCGSQDTPERAALLATMLDPCGGPDAPCSIADATPDAQRRTDELTAMALERLYTAADLDSVAAWLETQDDVVSVATGDEALRFRVRGGVGHWILIQTAGTVGTLASMSLPMPPTRPLSSVFGEAPSLRDQAPGPDKRNRRHKRALLLSPFRWQWEISGKSDGLDLVAAALRARDYRRGDVDVLTTSLDPRIPACQSTTRWPDCKVINNIQPASFTSWRDYDYVHLLTHGAAVTQDGQSLTAVMTPWMLPVVEAAQTKYTGAQLDFVNLIGTEWASVAITVPPEAVPQVGPGQVFGKGVPGAAVRGEIGTSRLDPALSQADRDWCTQQLDQQSDADRHAAGKPLAKTQKGVQCLEYSEIQRSTGRFVLLTSYFFYKTYGDGDGIDDAVILISACSSGLTPELLGALNGQRTAVIGWKKSVSISAAALAGTMIAEALVEVDEPVEGDSGMTIEQSIKRIATLLDDAKANPPTKDECEATSDAALETKCLLAYDNLALTVVNGEPADAVTGAAIALVGDKTIRAREVPYLMDLKGEELTDGAVLITRTSPDGSGDTLDLTIRVDGLSLEDDPSAVALEIAVDDQEFPVDQPLSRAVGNGVWELDYRLPLGRDYDNGETVDLEVRATPESGHESVWLYEDVMLTGSRFEYSVSGDATGDQDGWIWVSRLSSSTMDPTTGVCHANIRFVPSSAGTGLAGLTAMPLFGLTIGAQGGLRVGQYPIGIDEGMGMNRTALREANPDTFFASLSAELTNPDPELSQFMAAMPVGPSAPFFSRSGSVSIDYIDDRRIEGSFAVNLVGLVPIGGMYTDQKGMNVANATVTGRFSGLLAPVEPRLAQLNPPYESVYDCGPAGGGN